jgi:hypothetical protein
LYEQKEKNPPKKYLKKKNIFGLKYLNSLMRIQDGKNSDQGSWMEQFGSVIREKHPGSATLDVKSNAAPAAFNKLCIMKKNRR